MQVQQNRLVVLAFIKAVNAKRFDDLDQLVAPKFVRHSHATGRPKVRSRDQLKVFLRREFETFPDAVETIKELVAEDHKVAARHGFSGTQQGPMGAFPPTGRTMTAVYLAIYRIEKGRIMEAWVEWDNLSGLEPLGHYRPPA